MTRLSDRMGRLERANPVGLPLQVRAWLGQALTPAEHAKLASLLSHPTFVPPTEAGTVDWSRKARESLLPR